MAPVECEFIHGVFQGSLVHAWLQPDVAAEGIQFEVIMMNSVTYRWGRTAIPNGAS
jgi:hypothetical protein